MTSFPTQILTSSPSDFTILKAANATLNHIIENAEPLSTPFVNMFDVSPPLLLRNYILGLQFSKSAQKRKRLSLSLRNNDYQESTRFLKESF